MPRFFFLTTSKPDNLRQSVARGAWACIPAISRRLADALAGPEPVLCFLAARTTGNFAGMGRLVSPPLPGQTIMWEGDGDLAPPCALEWFFRADFPFSETEHILNALDDQRAVRQGRNGQEIDPAAGVALAALLEGAARSAGLAVPPVPTVPLALGPRPMGPPMLAPGAPMMMAPHPMMAAAMGGFAGTQAMMMHPALAMQGMGKPNPLTLTSGARDGESDRADIMSMSYEEYVDAFEALKGPAEAARPAQDEAAAGGGSKAAQSVRMMTEKQYVEHCKRYTEEMGMPFDEAVVRQHYANMKASLGGGADGEAADAAAA